MIMKQIDRGNRLKLCRSMLKKTLKELGSTYQVSIGSLSNWESGSSPISEKNVDKIISFLAAEGLICSKEWLLEGSGDSPYLYTPLQSHEGKKEEPFDLTTQFLFFKEIESFAKSHSEMLFSLVRDDSMLPFLTVGDYVGGPILSKGGYTREQGSICIVEIKKEEFLTRQMYLREDKILLLSNNTSAEHNFLLLEESPLKIAPVTFLRRFRE